MNAQTLIATLTFALTAGVATAQEATPDVPVQTGAVSRATVMADAARSVRAGEQHEARQIDNAAAKPVFRTREAVRAEAVAALKNGEIARLNAETWGFDRQLPSVDSGTRVAQSAR